MSGLAGKRTYLVAVIAGVVVGAQAAGLIPADLANLALKLLGVAGAITLRAAIG